jgi:lysozyme
MLDSFKISDEGLSLIKHFENFEAKPYICPAGKLTVGWGHVILPGEKFEAPLSLAAGEDLLKKDVEQFEAAVRDLVKVDLNQNQFDALVSFTFNVGIGARTASRNSGLAGSTLLRQLNEGKYAEAADQFLKWNKARRKGRELVILPGLTRRRKAERSLFLKVPDASSV